MQYSLEVLTFSKHRIEFMDSACTEIDQTVSIDIAMLTIGERVVDVWVLPPSFTYVLT
jgi:hypothetical protein